MEENILLSAEQEQSQEEVERFGQEQKHKQQTCRNSAADFSVRWEFHRWAECGQALGSQAALSRQVPKFLASMEGSEGSGYHIILNFAKMAFSSW